LICHTCNFTYYHNPAAVVIAILEHKDKIVLTRRAFEPQQGQLALPGGFVDYAETLEEALAREMKEELNLTIQAPRYLCSSWETYLYRGVQYYSSVVYFVVQIDDLSQAVAGDDITSFSLVSVEEIDPGKLAFASDRVALESYQA
jgi:ADP-ribose pyrophosphatase YjhB (NUDIX family)